VTHPEDDRRPPGPRSSPLSAHSAQASGAKTARPGLERALETLRAGDTLVVWLLDRLGRTPPRLISTVGGVQQRDVGFRSLQEAIDATSSTGNLVFQIFGAIAEFERNLVRERTQAGLAAHGLGGGWADGRTATSTRTPCSPRSRSRR
jgi:DNA invertase Pin-like site-specific DNA recombinase